MNDCYPSCCQHVRLNADLLKLLIPHLVFAGYLCKMGNTQNCTRSLRNLKATIDSQKFLVN